MAGSRIFSRIGAILCVLLLITETADAQLGIFATTPEDGPCSYPPASPHFSIKSGSYSAPLSVRLTDQARGAVIFYTTDGWTPTGNSTRYVGPIAIDRTTTVQAIALVPNCSISKPATATYELPSASQPATFAELPVLPGAHGALALISDARIPLAFASPVDSRTAQVGDAIAFTLTEDLKVGDTLLASKGTPAAGKVIQVDRSGIRDTPGEIQFQVDWLSLNGTRIPLQAVGALAGPYVARGSTTAIGVSTVGLSLLFVHGRDARILAGATLTATMAAGTPLPIAENSTVATAGPGAR